MSEVLSPQPPNFTLNFCQIKTLPVSSNATVNEWLKVESNDAGCCDDETKQVLKSIVKKSHRHMKKSIWSEYLKNRSRKNVKFNLVTKVMRFDYESGMRGVKEASEDLLTDTIQQVSFPVEFAMD